MFAFPFSSITAFESFFFFHFTLVFMASLASMLPLLLFSFNLIPFFALSLHAVYLSFATFIGMIQAVDSLPPTSWSFKLFYLKGNGSSAWRTNEIAEKGEVVKTFKRKENFKIGDRRSSQVVYKKNAKIRRRDNAKDFVCLNQKKVSSKFRQIYH